MKKQLAKPNNKQLFNAKLYAGENLTNRACNIHGCITNVKCVIK